MTLEHVPPPAPLERWLSPEQLRKGNQQQIKLSDWTWVNLRWIGKSYDRGYIVEWGPTELAWAMPRDYRLRIERRVNINDARKVFADRARDNAITFAEWVLNA